MVMSSIGFHSHLAGQDPLYSGADPTEQIHGSPRTTGEDISQQGSPTLEEGNHEPAGNRIWEGNQERPAVFGRREWTVPTKPWGDNVQL